MNVNSHASGKILLFSLPGYRAVETAHFPRVTRLQIQAVPSWLVSAYRVTPFVESSPAKPSSDMLVNVTNISESFEAKVPAQLKVFDVLLKRAAAANINAEVRSLEGRDPHLTRDYVLLELPNGRNSRQVPVFQEDVEKFLSIEFEKYTVLGDYLASVNKASGRIEALVGGPGAAGRVTAARYFQQLPGVEIFADGDPELDKEAFEDGVDRVRLTAENWRLAVEQDGVCIEISPASAEFAILFQGGVTIKVDGVITSNHEASLEAVERYATTMLFDLDVVYGVQMQLAKRRRTNRRRRFERPDHPPKFPLNRYAEQALELYQYGRSSAGLPLLEYLAYYQSVEYFFPFFAKEQTIQSVRSQLLHPGFDARNDASLSRLINLAAPAAKGGMAEREQLRATIRACMDEVDLRDFIESLPEYTDHFCSSKQKIKGVSALQLNRSQIC